MADQTSLLLASQMAFGASGLVGRHVTWSDADGEIHKGVVSGVTFGASGPVLDIGGTEVPLANVVSVTDGTSTPDATTDSDSD
ncbi:hypothetical protein [Nocardioides daphniae]|uniref:hypothetical protein n=1 Tax=Nocardioides daphniae TaxID=402297 RepID=UPI001476BE6C|nr:hypothetical protein [Nocardioides daphniae]